MPFVLGRIADVEITRVIDGCLGSQSAVVSSLSKAYVTYEGHCGALVTSAPDSWATVLNISSHAPSTAF
jgi:hypothetical protein